MNTPDMLSLSSANEKPRTPAKVDAEPTKQERRTLDAYIQRGKTERFSLVLNVTPGLAVAMLGHNIGNRKITEAQVVKHIERLKAGEFILHHHGISFAKTGVLNDGQHRLTAIARSGVAGQLQVTFGAEREEFGVIDQGKSRTAAHLLMILGYQNSANLAAFARVVMVANGVSGRAITPSSVAEFAGSISGELVTDAVHAGMNLKKVTAPSPVALAHYWIATRSKTPQHINAFFEGLNSGENLTHPKLKLRNWLIQPTDGSGLRGDDNTFHTASVIINAWNAWRTGRKTFLTTFGGRDSIPEPK